MAEEKPARAVLSMGAPLVMGMFIMVLYNLVDTFFIGLMHDDYQLAAVNLGYPVMMVMIALGNMVGTGASSLIARSLGAEDREQAERTLLTGYEMAFAVSVIFMILGLAALHPLVNLLGARENTAELTAQYVQVLLIGNFFIMGNYTFGQLLRSEGSVSYSVAGMVAGTIANILLDPIFIFLLGLGVRGAAIATVLGNLLGCLVFILYYRRGKTLLSFRRIYLRPRTAIIKEIFWVGVPASLETLLTASTFVVLNNLAVGYGEVTVAAMGISQKLMSLGGYIYQGFAAGLQPLMGYNYGARNYPRMLRLLRAAVLVTGVCELIVMAGFGLFAPQLIHIFSQTDQVVRIGARVLRANMCILPFVGAVSCSRASFQSMGKPMYALLITCVRQLVLYVPALLLMNRCFGFTGLIWTQPMTECIMMVFSLTLLSRYLRGLSRETF